jgi:hypothetical protein
MTFKKIDIALDVKKSNSSNETPNVMTVGVENYGLIGLNQPPHPDSATHHRIFMGHPI